MNLKTHHDLIEWSGTFPGVFCLVSVLTPTIHLIFGFTKTTMLQDFTQFGVVFMLLVYPIGYLLKLTRPTGWEWLGAATLFFLLGMVVDHIAEGVHPLPL